MRNWLALSFLLFGIIVVTSCHSGSKKSSSRPYNGIAYVENDLQGLYPDLNENDQQVTRNVKLALLSEQFLSPRARNIHVSTDNKVVTLQGTVTGDYERDQVIKIVRGVKGVKRINDELKVAPIQNQ